VRPLLVAIWVAVVAAAPARAGSEPQPERPPHRELCGAGARHRGAAIDLDLKGAEIHDVFRLLADAGHVNIVVPDDVTGTVTLRLVRVAWDAAACAIAGVHHLRISVYDGDILVVTRAAPAAGVR
jgi:hypothetical protein